MFRPFDLFFLYYRFRFWRAGFHQKTIRIRNQIFRFWEGGKGDPILLIHGLGGSTIQDFRRLALHLVANHHVISFDLPGFGLSHHFSFQQSVANQAEFVREFLDQIHIDQTHVIGNSMGGWIALKLAHRYSHRIQKLVLMASAGIRFNHPPLEIFTPNHVDGMLKLLSYLFHKSPSLPNWFIRDWLRVSRQRRPSVVQMLESMLTEQDLLDDQLHEIRIPTLILWGEHDRLIPVEVGHRLASIMPNARLEVMPTCGHLPLHEDFRGVAMHLDAWFATT